MIASKCFTGEWIETKRADLRVADPGLLEKCIHALELLGLLANKATFEFVFKGGTSLVLLLASLRRLSIDIDITSMAAPEEYEPILSEIGHSSPFLRYEEDERGDNCLPERRHFKFFYESLCSQSQDYVLLDMLEETNIFPETQAIPIQTPFVETEEETLVVVPTIDGLAGDKLTAFAPTTVGIPLTEQYSMQVVKQIFDIGELFNAVESLDLVKRTYGAVFAAENGYRGSRFSLDKALEDTIETAFLICQMNLRGGVTDNRTTLIQNGIGRVANHLVGDPFRLDDAKVAVSKAACLATVLRQDIESMTIDQLRFDPDQSEELRSVSIESRPILDRLKPVNPEAFHYWHVAERISNR